MQIIGKDSAVEKQFLVGMIVSDTFLKRIFPLVKPGHLALPSVAKVAEWVLDYFEKYAKAPGRELMNIFEERRRGLKESEAEWISGFLKELSEGYEGREDFNEDYLFHRCAKYLKVRKLQVSTRTIQDLLDKGKDEQAEALWLEGMKMPMAMGLGIDPFDPETIKTLYERDEERVAIGIGVKSIDEMVGPVKSGWLAVFLGPMKRGKTQALKHVAVRAWLKGYDTVFISLETEDFDMAVRLWSDVGSLSVSGSTVQLPYFTNKERGEEVSYKNCARPKLDKGSALRAVRKAGHAVHSRFRLRSFPMGIAGIKEIKQYLDMLEVYENLYPHVIVVDYIGAMAAPAGIRGRDTEYNYNSMMLKALAQERKAAVFSGHQGTRETLEKMNASATDTSQDIRVFANVDALYILNQTDEEMDKGVMRIGVGGHRHSKFSRIRQALVLQQFAVGQFALDDIMIDAPFGGKGGKVGRLKGKEGERNGRKSGGDSREDARHDTDK